MNERPERQEYGEYVVESFLGKGSIGKVWLARHRRFGRRVALKTVHLEHKFEDEIDRDEFYKRLQREAELCGAMQHPNIVTLYDVGYDGELVSYLATEYVDGESLLARLRRTRPLPLNEAISIAADILRGLAYAHSKGIIHRDIKPANILLTADGQAKIADFGVARPLHSSLTATRSLVGTPNYMSPEQVKTTPVSTRSDLFSAGVVMYEMLTGLKPFAAPELSALDVDTRTDVYSLGVLLYELLTGATPLGAKLRAAPLSERLRLIREEEPPRPSTRLAQTTESLPELADRRRTDPTRLRREVRGDLDWIVMKALEKDRTRRYDTAAALARDVERYLQHEPVEATPPSTGYRLGKTLRKYRTAAVAGAISLLLLIGGAAVSAWQAVRATRAEREAAAVNDFLLRDLLGQADLANLEAGVQGRDPDVTVRTLLDRAAANIEGKFSRQPLTEASLRSTIGKTYQGLGRYLDAQPHLERAVQLYTATAGANHPDALGSKNDLGWLYWYSGKYDAAEKLFVDVAFERDRALGPRHLQTLDSKHGLAVVYWSLRQFDKAEALLQHVVEARTTQLGAEHRDTLTAKNNLAVLYRSLRRYDRAEPLFRELTETRAARLGADHPDTLQAKNNLATVLRDQKRFDEAEPLLLEVIQSRTAKLGPDHPATLRTESSLALLYRERKEYARAEALFLRTIRGRMAKLGAEHPDTLRSKANLAVLYRERGEHVRAEPLFREAVDGSRHALGIAHPDTQQRIADLVACLEAEGKFAQAEPLIRELAAYWREKSGERSAEHVQQLERLERNLLEQAKPAGPPKAARRLDRARS